MCPRGGDPVWPLESQRRECAQGDSAEAKAVYRLRGQTIEIVFADLKEHRGLRRFSGHGLTRARTELALEVLVHNLLVLHRFANQQQHGQEIDLKPNDIAA